MSTIFANNSAVSEAPLKGRFAPSPTGRMHAGNIYSALCSWLIVKSTGGSIVLRVDDLDPERSKPAFADQVMRDFEQLGLFWDEGPFFQQGREEAYRAAFEKVSDGAPVYPCFCTRADLHAASAPHLGERNVYQGTCRQLTAQQQAERQREGRPCAWRVQVPDEPLRFQDLLQGPQTSNLACDCGDFVIRRADHAFGYHLATVVDDAEQGVNCVVRGIDLLSSTPQQIYLQRLLDLETPVYGHMPLLVNLEGKRLAKRDRDAALDALLATYRTPEALVGHIAHIGGLQDEDQPASPQQLLQVFNLEKFASKAKAHYAITWL